MVKNAIAILFVCIMAFSMAACGASPSPATTAGASSKPGGSTAAVSDTQPNDESLPEPSLEAYASADLTFKVETASDNSLKIIMHDPALVEQYRISGSQFRIVWEMWGYNSDDVMIFIATASSPVVDRKDYSPITVDMRETAARQGTAESVTAFVCDTDSRTLTWEIKLKEGLAKTYAHAKAFVNLEYSEIGGDIHTYMMREAD